MERFALHPRRLAGRQRLWLGRDARLAGRRARHRAARAGVRQVGAQGRHLLARGLHLRSRLATSTSARAARCSTTTGTRVNDGATLLYRASKARLRRLRLKPRCCPKTPARKVPRSIHEGARDMAREIAKSWEGRVSRRLRKKVEMLFAHLKRILQARPAATARPERRPRRVPPRRHRPEPPQARKADPDTKSCVTAARWGRLHPRQ